MSIHLNLPLPVKASTDSITKSCFQTSLILLEGLFILVCGLILYFCEFLFVISSFFPRLHDNFQPSCLHFPPHWSYHFLSRILLRAVVRHSRFPSFHRPIFFLLFLGRSCVFSATLPPALPRMSGGNFHLIFAQAQIAHSYLPYFAADFICLAQVLIFIFFVFFPLVP